MESTVCALCDAEIIKENDSKEHIIPNAIGGRKKIRGFICRTCNRNSGDDWDVELAKQLNPLSLFFGVIRDRGTPPSQLFSTTEGDKLRFNSDGATEIEKPIYNERILESGVGTQIKIQARSMPEAKRMLKGVVKKYPQLDLDEILSTAKSESVYCSDMLHFNITLGGHSAGRSIVKTALAMAFDSGIPARECKEAIDYLKHESAEACFGYYYESDLVVNRPEGVPLHCVSVTGCNESKQLLAYVEYFGSHRMVVGLSSSYQGDSFSKTYAINPALGKELNISVDLELSRSELQETYDYKKIPVGAVEKAFEGVISTRMETSFNNEKERVLAEATKYAFENCGANEGEVLMPENIDKLADLMTEKLMPFIVHQIPRRRKK